MTTPNTVKDSAWGPILKTTIAKGNIVLDAADNAGHQVTRVYGYNTTPDHNNLRCIDFMHYLDTSMRDWLVMFLRTNAKRLGVVGIISNHLVMGFPSNGAGYRGPEGEWRPYTGPDGHTDHLHVEFNSASPIMRPTPGPKPAADTDRSFLMGTIKRHDGFEPAAAVDKWSTVHINRHKDVSLAFTEGNVLATVDLSAVVPPGATVQGRFYTVSYKSGTETKRLHSYPPCIELTTTGGSSFGNATLLIHLDGTDKAGRSERLRFEVIAYGSAKPVPVDVEFRVLVDNN